MLNHYSERICDCYQHAAYCARKADQQTNPQLQIDYLTLAKLWRNLARSYEFTEQATGFSNDASTGGEIVGD